MSAVSSPFAALLRTASSALLLAGCAVPHDRVDRSVEVPAAWRAAQPATRDTEPDARWWSRFGSPELDALILQAQTQNLDLAAAAARLRQAEAQARIVGAALFPELTAMADGSREARVGGNATVSGNAFSVGFAARYEVDLWGRYRALSGEARHAFRASAFDHDAIRLMVTANVAVSWLQALGMRERVAIAERNLGNARRVLLLVEARGRAGAVAPLDLAQQRGLVAARERSLAALRQQASDARTALAVLLGQSASTFELFGPALEVLHASGVGAGAPSLLLTRRPDIARAEAQLAAADADVSAARAAMLPTVTLSAGVGMAGSRFGHVLQNPVYSLAAALAAPIFDGGRLAGSRDFAQARREELLAAYRAAVVGAFADVDVALDVVAGVDAQAVAQREEVEQARRAAELSEARYRAGAETLLASLDAQRTLYEAQDLEVQLRQARLQARVALYRALGGGWRNEGDDTAW